MTFANGDTDTLAARPNGAYVLPPPSHPPQFLARLGHLHIPRLRRTRRLEQHDFDFLLGHRLVVDAPRDDVELSRANLTTSEPSANTSLSSPRCTRKSSSSSAWWCIGRAQRRRPCTPFLRGPFATFTNCPLSAATMRGC